MSSDKAPPRPKNRPAIDLGQQMSGFVEGGDGQAAGTDLTKSDSQDSILMNITGKRTDVVHGTSLGLSFFITALAGLGAIGVTLFVYFDNEGHYELGLSFIEAIGGNEDIWEILVFLPLIFGSLVVFLSTIMMIFSFLTVRQAENFERLVRGTFGKDSGGNVQSKFGNTSKCIIYVVKFCALAAVILQLLFSILALQVLNSVDKSVNSGALSDVTNSSIKAKTLGFGLAVFNECCASKNWTQQGVIPKCAPDHIPGDPVACTVPDPFELYEDGLCTCYQTTDAEYDEFIQIIRDRELCGFLSHATTEVDLNQRVPGSGLSIQIVYDVPLVRVVGDFAASDQGCGVGFGVGLQWILYQWMRGYMYPLGIALIVFSIVEVLAVLYGIYINYTGVQMAIVEERIRLEEEAERRERMARSPLGRLRKLSFFSSPKSSKKQTMVGVSEFNL